MGADPGLPALPSVRTGGAIRPERLGDDGLLHSALPLLGTVVAASLPAGTLAHGIPESPWPSRASSALRGQVLP